MKLCSRVSVSKPKRLNELFLMFRNFRSYPSFMLRRSLFAMYQAALRMILPH